MPQEINQAGLNLIKEYEGLRLTAYDDGAGYMTIGYGHRIKEGENYDNGITEEQATDLLKSDVETAENIVRKCIRTTLTDNQFSALVSLVFNCGKAPLLGTIGRMLNNMVNPDYQAAADAFLLWDKAAGKTMAGLLRRRAAERDLFLTTT